MPRKPSSKADLDLELDSYDPSGSDSEYDDNEKEMMRNAAKKRSKIEDDDEESEEEVFGIHESDEDEDEPAEDMEVLGDEMDSDIEDKDHDRLPDSKAWGSKKNVYYKTDYVDEDYGGFSKAEEEEAALKEEEEARSIQTRLIAELDDLDLSSLGITTPKVLEKKKEASSDEDEFGKVIKKDISKMSKREKMELLEKESPEFKGLVSDFKERLAYARDRLEPILTLVKSGEIPPCPAAEFVSTKYHATLNYCTNIAFYLLLKSKRVKVSVHPVIRRLVQFRKLLEEMDPIDKEVIQPQVDEILELKNKGKQLKVIESIDPVLPVVTGNRAQRRKMLQQIREEIESKHKKPNLDSFENMHRNTGINEEGNEDQQVENETEKRGITYEIAKNKGLTPKRKKENRNPRVKHRNKFRKATIRRKGQVSSVIPRSSHSLGISDGIVPFGIKKSVVKSRKLQ